jgi:hypothetical protein
VAPKLSKFIYSWRGNRPKELHFVGRLGGVFSMRREPPTNVVLDVMTEVDRMKKGPKLDNLPKVSNPILINEKKIHISKPSSNPMLIIYQRNFITLHGSYHESRPHPPTHSHTGQQDFKKETDQTTETAAALASARGRPSPASRKQTNGAR